jgi:hypothetical protein
MFEEWLLCWCQRCTPRYQLQLHAKTNEAPAAAKTTQPTATLKSTKEMKLFGCVLMDLGTKIFNFSQESL